LTVHRLLPSGMQCHFHALIHLSVALIDIEYLDTSLGIDLMHGIARRSTRFSEYRLFTITTNPNITLSATFQTNAFADVQSNQRRKRQNPIL
jgi:hypothetical protein